MQECKNLNATKQRHKLFLITILFPFFSPFFPLTVSVCLYISAFPFSLVQDDKVSSREACRDLRGLLALSLLRLPPWLSAGLPEILWRPKRTPETSCDSSILDRQYQCVKLQNYHYCLGMNARSFVSHITTFI